jgi:monothiol glutaredoxin
MDPTVRAQIEKAIAQSEVLLFMKGTRSAPSCGFSAKTVELLNTLMSSYSTVDVLSHPEIREAIKEYSSWPTIPQLYIRGEFVGGADIIGEMYESGELHQRLGVAAVDSTPPAVTITDRAAEAFRSFLGDSDEVVLLEIDRSYQNALSIGPRPASALISESHGISVAFDRLSATRAEGLVIDYVETPEGAAFKLQNPNEPPQVKPMSVAALKAKMDRKDRFRLIDVRRPDEWEQARIAGAELLDADLSETLLSLPKDTVLVFQCHHGHRSHRAASQFVAQGYREVYNLTGGIDAWSAEVDSSVPRY